MEYRHLINDPSTSTTWKQSAANEFGLFMEGLKIGIIGTQKMKMVHRSDIPKYREVTYAWFVCDYIYQKEEANELCITAEGDRVD